MHPKLAAVFAEAVRQYCNPRINQAGGDFRRKLKRKGRNRAGWEKMQLGW
jgi:hypothetical protein